MQNFNLQSDPPRGTPRVSVIVPTFNYGSLIAETITSLQQQTFPHWECIIVDDGSTDNTRDVVKHLSQNEPRVRYLQQPNQRQAAAKSLGLGDARGEYFMWAAHDDRRHPQYLSRCVAALSANPRGLFCCTGVRLIDEEGHDVSDTFPFHSDLPMGATPRARLLALLSSTAWLHIYSLIRTPALAQTRLGTYLWGGDVILTAEMCLRGEVAVVPDKLFDYRYFAGALNMSNHTFFFADLRCDNFA